VKSRPAKKLAAPESRNLRDVFLLGWRPYLWLLGLILILFVHCLSYGLILLDDNVFVLDKFPIISDWGQLAGIFHRGSFLGPATGEYYYRPLLVISFMIDAHLGGQDLAVYHLSNLLFHFVSTALVFRILRRIIGPDQAFLLAAVFAVHPALAGSVAWINGRTDSFLAMFLLACFHCYQYLIEDGKWRWVVLHLIFWTAALLSKELAAVVPAACLTYSWLVDSRLIARSRQAALIIGWGAGLAAWLMARRTFLHPALSYTAGGIPRSVLANLPALIVYWGKAFIPVHLSPYPVLVDEPRLYGFIAAAAVAVALWLSRPLNWRALLWGIGWFLLFLMPSFVYPDRSITPVFFEYRLYLPMLGVLILLAQFGPIKRFSVDRPMHLISAAVILIALSAASWADIGAYKDDLTAWRRAALISPHSAFAHRQLGVAYYFRKDYRDSEAEYLETLRLEPDIAMAHNNLGVVYMETGRLNQAEKEYRLELKTNPGYENALKNLDIVYKAEGRPPRAR